MSDERLKIAVFIDFDNIEIGVKTTLTQHFDVGIVLEALKERGEIVTKVAYGDWTRAGDYGRAMSQHAIHMVQRNLTPGGDKNGADINLALDALEMAFTHNHINTFVIVGGDSDFISLVEKLKQYDRKVFVVGGRAFTSVVMQKNCSEFIAYENLISRGGRSVARVKPAADLTQVLPLVRRAIKLLADREVLPQLGLLKSTLLQLDSAFSEREYGASSFRDFVQKLANAGFVTLKGSDRSFHVELKESADREGATVEHERGTHGGRHDGNGRGRDEAHGRGREERHREERHRDERHRDDRSQGDAHGRPRDEAHAREADEPAEQPGEGESLSAGESLRRMQHEGYEIIRRAFTRPDYHPRWPMYVRQVKQVLKATDEPFDERRFGFGGIIEALRYAQREGLFRVERDRMGVVRVFAGDQLLKPAAGRPDVEALAAASLDGGTLAIGGHPELPLGEPSVAALAAPSGAAAPRHVEAMAEESAEAAVDDDEFDGKFVDEALGTPADADVLEGSQPIPVENEVAHQEATAGGTKKARRGSRGGRGRGKARDAARTPEGERTAGTGTVEAAATAGAPATTGAAGDPPAEGTPTPEAPAAPESGTSAAGRRATAGRKRTGTGAGSGSGGARKSTRKATAAGGGGEAARPARGRRAGTSRRKPAADPAE